MHAFHHKTIGLSQNATSRLARFFIERILIASSVSVGDRTQTIRHADKACDLRAIKGDHHGH